MGLRDLATVLVRLYGLVLLFDCLNAGQQVIVYKAILTSSTYSSSTGESLTAGLISSTVSAILHAIIGGSFLLFGKTIARWIAPKISNGFNIIVSAGDLALVGFSMAGIFFFVDGVSRLVDEAVIWYFSPLRVFPTLDHDARTTARVAASGIKTAVGLFLIFGSKPVLRVLRWVRGESVYDWETRKEETRQLPIELPKLPKCPNCGTEYNPEDYRQDALEWLCPLCRKTLPKE